MPRRRDCKDYFEWQKEKFCPTMRGMKKNPGGRPRLEPGPAGEPNPMLPVRVKRSLLARLKKQARAEDRSLSELVRERLEG